MADDVLRIKGPVLPPEFSSNYREKHSGDEALCFDRVSIDQAAAPAQGFGKIFEIQPWLGDSRFASVVRPRASSTRSPSRAFVVKPSLNCGFAVNAVFRIMRVNSDLSAEFSTGWVASPPVLTEDERYMFFGVCTAHTFDKAEEADYYKGCFGVVGRPKGFRNRGFFIQKDPLFCLKQDGADIAVIQFFVEASERIKIIPPNISFLLPCSPSQYGAPGAHLATFGYNSFTWFLQQAKMELKDGSTSELSFWELYGDTFSTRVHLYSAIRETVDEFEECSLCCSPSAVVDLQGNYGKIRSSTLEGCSGGPLMPNEVEGVVCYIHRGREPSSRGYDLLNRATGLDVPEFVECYSKYILKFIPGKMEGRETLPFRRWCGLHGLPCPIVDGKQNANKEKSCSSWTNCLPSLLLTQSRV